MKRAICLIFTLMLCVGMFSACSSSSDKTTNAVVKFMGTKEEWDSIAGTEDINSEVIYNYKSND